MNLIDTIKNLTKQLLPTGRAFYLPGWGESLNNAIATVEANFYTDSLSVLDSLMPDTDRFTAADCTNWERILGVPTNSSNTIADRRAAIRRKMSQPGINPAKGHFLTIEEQLQLAGFPVYVHENLFVSYPSGDYYSVNPATISPGLLSPSQHGGGSQHGPNQSAYINHVVANSIYNSRDISFVPGADLNNTFFIGGQVLGTYVNIPATREIEFRQLILQLKQTHKIAFLLINYV